MKTRCLNNFFTAKPLVKLFSTILVILFFCCYSLVIHIYLPSDINECTSKTHLCDINAKCINTPTSYECKCNEGFYGNGWKCDDLNECTQLQAPCWPNSRCSNTVGGYFCECLPGFKQNGTQCNDIDECITNPCNQQADCLNKAGSFQCKCKEEFEGDGFSCVHAMRECKVPQNVNFQRCAEKVEWLKKFWKSHPCYAKNGADGTVCSFLSYLSEVEHHCPLLPNRQPRHKKNKRREKKAPTDRADLEQLLNVVRSDNNFKWIRTRISSMWNDWVNAMKTLSTKQDMKNRQAKQILIFVGVLAEQTWAWAENAKRGGPLGELVQWSDLIAALYLLGHDLYVSANVRELLSSSGAGTNPCGDDAVGLTEFDIIYIDIHGLQMLKKNGFDVTTLKCKYRILDTFGTEARFNYMDYIEESELSFNGNSEKAQSFRKNPYGYGDWKFHLNQFLTMFPHSPDNSFLGFVVSNESHPKVNISAKRNIALVYGKQNYMWLGKSEYLNSINKYVKIHATVMPDIPAAQANGQPGSPPQYRQMLFNVPSFVMNHGLIEWNKLQSFLDTVKIFVGLGFPFEGPAPLEAISKGCVFLNPEFSPGFNRQNDLKINNKWFFEGKPTLRKLKSQHPYLQQFVGKPHIWTVNTNDKEAVESAIKNILEAFEKGEIKPYLPYEFTHEGLLQRLNSYVSHQNFCEKDKRWPPTTSLKARLAKKGESCVERCVAEGLLCENSLFPVLNSEVRFTESGVNCKTVAVKKSLFAPYVVDSTCILQDEPLVYSCVDSAEKYQRLCPCRDYIQGQVALCKDCL